MAGGDENGRPTIRPPFDMDAFARDATGAEPTSSDTPTERSERRRGRKEI